MKDKQFYKMCQKRSRFWNRKYIYNRIRISRKYKKEFMILEGFLDFSYELGAAMDKLIPQPEKPVLQFALLRIHEKALKVARESKIMLENGSASGAMARWRTLFEFSIVANLLIKYPELAEKYIVYSKVDDYKYARKLVEYQDRLHLDNCDMSAFPEIEKEYETVLQQYGWKGKNNYEWAKNEAIKKTNLFELAKAVGQEHFYAYVDESHLYNHPSMRYLLNDRGAREQENDNETYLFSPFDMDLPIQLIACSLHQANCALLQGYAQLDSADAERLAFYSKKNGKFPETITALVVDKIKQGNYYVN